MNYQQVLGLIMVCALVMVPLGALLGSLYRWVSALVRDCLPPRYFKTVGVRRRTITRDAGGGR
ncbi:cellulose biosynthesis protein BcsF [Stenotrophomonas sp.]|uniref:cellulose biosynthesis protein BcsF n=1 Tax=Stenotrophomonas sp. TaxID=69392 RepID=UPI0025E96D1E|nr:cellulose biosynthesis protein BcsF [Stenotrophomonas sp.]MBW8375518.1 cellulose biosynthesis protein BcsF [Stenotrophomonas sp.]